MGNLLQSRPAETTTAAAGTIGAIIAAAASHDYTTAVVLAVVAYLPAIITLLHLQAGGPGKAVAFMERVGGQLGYTRKPGETDAAYAERLTASVEKIGTETKVLIDGKPVATGGVPTAPASTEPPPPIQGP